MEKLTSNEYMALESLRCPYCMSHDHMYVEEDQSGCVDINRDENEIVILKKCKGCDGEWQEIFGLRRISFDPF